MSASKTNIRSYVYIFSCKIIRSRTHYIYGFWNSFSWNVWCQRRTYFNLRAPHVMLSILNIHSGRTSKVTRICYYFCRNPIPTIWIFHHFTIREIWVRSYNWFGCWIKLKSTKTNSTSSNLWKYFNTNISRYSRSFFYK